MLAVLKVLETEMYALCFVRTSRVYASEADNVTRRRADQLTRIINFDPVYFYQKRHLNAK